MQDLEKINPSVDPVNLWLGDCGYID